MTPPDAKGGPPHPRPETDRPDAANGRLLSLNDVPPGATCRVHSLEGSGPVRQRLLDLGIIPKNELTVIRSAPLYDPIELMVDDTFVVLRRHEAAWVKVEHV